jgi:outer membrane autotransporter protein
VLTPFVRVAWLHEFNPDRDVDALLTQSPAATFSPVGASAAEDAAKVDAGVRLDVTQRIALYGFFEGEFSDRGQGTAGFGGGDRQFGSGQNQGFAGMQGTNYAGRVGMKVAW